MIQIEQELSKELIVKIVEDYKANQVPKFEKLERYYKGKSDILQRYMEAGKPNNKVVHNYAGYIVDMINGYTLGKPVRYTSNDDNLMADLQDIFNYNDEADENVELGKIALTNGVAREIVYADEEGNLRFNELKPTNSIVVYNTKINPEPIFAIRFYSIKNILNNTDKEKIEVYTADEIIYYEKDGTKLTEVERIPHYFSMVPVIDFPANNEYMGAFEKVISAIDAYDIAVSSKINDLDYFSDAYMYIVGMQGTQPEDIAEMRSRRVILLEENGQAGFLVKPSNDAESENVKNRLKSDIHKFSQVPDMSDTQFSSNASGVAMAYKLIGLDQVAAQMERKFTTGLRRRIEIITNYLNLKGKNYDFRDISISFSRNKPVNEKEAVEIATNLKGIVSEQTAISYLPMIDDVSTELEAIREEREAFNLDSLEGDTLGEELP